MRGLIGRSRCEFCKALPSLAMENLKVRPILSKSGNSSQVPHHRFFRIFSSFFLFFFPSFFFPLQANKGPEDRRDRRSLGSRDPLHDVFGL